MFSKSVLCIWHCSKQWMSDVPRETRKGMNASVKVRHAVQVASAVQAQQRSVVPRTITTGVTRTVVYDVATRVVNVNKVANVNDAVNVTEIEVGNADAVTEATAENAGAGTLVTYPGS